MYFTNGLDCLSKFCLVFIVSPYFSQVASLMVFSERELTFTFAMLSPVRLSVACLSVTYVRPTQAVQIFGNISTALGTLVTR